LDQYQTHTESETREKSIYRGNCPSGEQNTFQGGLKYQPISRHLGRSQGDRFRCTLSLTEGFVCQVAPIKGPCEAQRRSRDSMISCLLDGNPCVTSSGSTKNKAGCKRSSQSLQAQWRCPNFFQPNRVYNTSEKCAFVKNLSDQLQRTLRLDVVKKPQDKLSIQSKSSLLYLPTEIWSFLCCASGHTDIPCSVFSVRCL
jgi:hypothetical protein